MPTPDPVPDDLAKYRRLDAFLRRLNGDIYPEPSSEVHDGISARMFEKVRAEHVLAPGARVLDIGCGQGAALELFRQAGFEGVGITLGQDAAVCRAKGFEVLETDFTFLDFADRSFDLVWCRHALEHSVMPYFLLSEIHRILKPGGALYLEVPAPDTACAHQTNPNHYSVMGKSMVLELLQRAGFPKIVTWDLNFKTGVGPDTYWAFLQTRPA